jgi:glyoxylase-like metal-dependent hydrolase (beta-lactamase superfamily II)
MRITDSVYLVGSLQLGISGPWDCHVYVVKGADGLVMIDAGGGGSGERILDNMRHDGLRPDQLRSIVITHNHFDHSGGAFEIRRSTGCEVYVSSRSRALLEGGSEEEVHLPLARRLGIYPEDYVYRNCPVDRGLGDGEEFESGGVRFRVITVEGHSPDSICLLTTVDGARNLFVGDVLFYGGILGLINFPGSTMDGYRSDLAKLAGCAVDGLYPGHHLFTTRNGQRHIDAAITRCRSGSIPHSIGQFGAVF